MATLPPAAPFSGVQSAIEVTVDETNRSPELQFQLARPASVTGQVTDSVTRKPMAGLPVSALQYGFSLGRPMTIPTASATTDSEGRFHLNNLVPTDYVVVVGPLMRSRSNLEKNQELTSRGAQDVLMTEFSKEDQEATDEDYDISYWPGGFDFSMVSPLRLPSGAAFDLGQLTVTKVRKYRALFQVKEQACHEGDRVFLDVRADHHLQAPFSTTRGSFACGQQALLRGLAPGEYKVEARIPAKEQQKALSTTYTRFVVNRENVAVSIPTILHVDLEGKVIAANASALPSFDDMRIHLQPVDFGAMRHALIPVSLDGRFRIENTNARRYRLLIAGMPPTHYVRELRYNGQVAKDMIFEVVPGSLTQQLELELGDRPAVVTGQVQDDHKPVRKAYVALASWPLKRDEQLFLTLLTAETDEQGHFVLRGVAPGEYRLIAVRQQDQQGLQRPGVLERLLRAGMELTLTQSQTKAATANVSKLERR